MTQHLQSDKHIRIYKAEDVFRVTKYLLAKEEKIDRGKEHFWMMGLDSSNHILYVEMMTLGNGHHIFGEPINVFRLAIWKNALKVIMIHSYPSGSLTPSDYDKDLTDRFIQAGRILNIKPVDYIIISAIGFMSFAESGLFSKIERSTKWVPFYRRITEGNSGERQWLEEIEGLRLEIEMEKSKTLRRVLEEKKKNKEAVHTLAKEALKLGLDLKTISNTTGLTVEQIKKL